MILILKLASLSSQLSTKHRRQANLQRQFVLRGDILIMSLMGLMTLFHAFPYVSLHTRGTAHLKMIFKIIKMLGQDSSKLLRIGAHDVYLMIHLQETMSRVVDYDMMIRRGQDIKK